MTKLASANEQEALPVRACACQAKPAKHRLPQVYYVLYYALSSLPPAIRAVNSHPSPSPPLPRSPA